MSNRDVQLALFTLKMIAVLMMANVGLLIFVLAGVFKMTEPATCHATSMTTQVCEFG